MNAIETLEQIATSDPKEIQVSGTHYKNRKMEPLDFLQQVAEAYGYTIASACKYILRYKNKGQAESDLLKIAHYAQLHKHQQDSLHGINVEVDLKKSKAHLMNLLHLVGVEEPNAVQMFDYITSFAVSYAKGDGEHEMYLKKLFECIKKELLALGGLDW